MNKDTDDPQYEVISYEKLISKIETFIIATNKK